MAWYKRSLRFSVYILQKRAIWQQRNTMNIVGTGISNKNISAQIVVWIITLKICRCDDSNYGWYFTCGLLRVWIHQTKDLDKRRQILITSHATRQKYWNFSYFRIKIEDLKVLALRGGEWRLRCVLSGALTHFSPLLPARGQANSYCISKPRPFY